MFKKQMRFQKIICYLCLIAAALVFVYSLGIMTDLYDSLYVMIPDPEDMSMAYVSGAEIYYDMQPFNRNLTKDGIVLILLSAFMLVMNTHVRRKYYIGNYVSIGLTCVANIASSVWAVNKIMAYKEQYLSTVDFESLKMWAEVWGTPYIDSTFWFDVCFFVFGVLIVTTVLLVINLIWKIIVTKEEALLIAKGKEV